MTRSVVKKLMKYNVKSTVEVTTRRVITKIMKETTGDAFIVGFDVQKEAFKTPKINVVERVLTNIIEHGLLDINLRRNVYVFARYSRCMDVLSWPAVSRKFIVTPIAPSVKKQFDKMVEEVRLKKTLEHPPRKWGMMQISPTLLNRNVTQNSSFAILHHWNGWYRVHCLGRREKTPRV